MPPAIYFLVSNQIPNIVIPCYAAAMAESDNYQLTGARLLRQARDQAGITLRELARRAGTSHPTVHAYESGTKVPSVATFLKLLDACGFAVDFDLSPRIRWQDGMARGDELEAVLKLAGQFPAKVSRYMDYPMFGRTDGSH